MKQVNSSDDISWRRQSTKSDALLTVKNFDNILCRDPINGLKEINELLEKINEKCYARGPSTMGLGSQSSKIQL